MTTTFSNVDTASASQSYDPCDNQIYGNYVVEKTWYDQNKNPADQGYEWGKADVQIVYVHGYLLDGLVKSRIFFVAGWVQRF